MKTSKTLKRTLMTAALAFSSGCMYGQVGVNTTSPKATLDVVAKTTDGSRAEGLMAPRLSGDQIKAGDAQYGSAQTGMIVYATSPVTVASTKTAAITAPGYYYYNGSTWQKITGIPVADATTSIKGIVQLAGDLSGTASSPSIADNVVTSAKILDATVANTDLAAGTGGIYKGSGTLPANTTVTMGANVLAFPSTATTGTSHFTVDGTTLNVDAVNNKVGIGNATPGEKLHVSEGGNNAVAVAVTNNAGTGRFGMAGNLGDYAAPNVGDVVINNTNDTGGIALTRGNLVGMYLNSSNNIGIGTNTPAGRLGVNGPKPGFSVGTGASNDGPTLVAISAANVANRYNDWPSSWGGGLSTWDVVGAGAYFTTYMTRSDARLKTAIKTIDSSIYSNFMKIRPVTYLMKERIPETEGLQYGFIAQEIAELFPSIVTKASDPAGTIGMNYQALISPTIYVVQQQQKQIDDLTKKIEKLEAKIEFLSK